MSLSWWFIALNVVLVTLTCNQNGYTLIPEDITDKTLVHCSTKFEDISSYRKLNSLLSQDGVTGIYKTSNTVARLCFSSPGTGRLNLGSFSGGTPYMLGE